MLGRFAGRGKLRGDNSTSEGGARGARVCRGGKSRVTDSRSLGRYGIVLLKGMWPT